MNEEQERLLNEYQKELMLLGKSVKFTGYIKVTLFDFVNDRSLDILRLKVSHAEQFQTYLVSLTNEKGNVKYSKNTVFGIISYIKSFYSFLKRRKYILSNPFGNLRRSKQGKSLPKNILNEESMNKLLTDLKDYSRVNNLRIMKRLYKAHVVCELMYGAGARINEVIKLKPDDIDFTKGIVILNDSKTGRTREGLLNEYALNVLKYYLEIKDMIIDVKGDRSRLFGNCGQTLKIWLNGILKEECKRLKLAQTRTHYFRHAIGYHLLRAGCDIRFIQEILGHKNLKTTAIYTHIDKEDLRNVIDKYHPRQFIRNKQ